MKRERIEKTQRGKYSSQRLWKEEMTVVALLGEEDDIIE
tara:strand:- start:125 stop:241 length:117 start_codon:yes stop_codon:yes gene_type:complete